MKRALIALLLMLTPIASCELCTAQAVGVDLTGAAPGKYFVVLVLHADGTIQGNITNVITIGPGTVPGGGGGGGGGDSPTAPSLTTTIAARSVDRVTDPNRAMNAKKLALVYSTIAAQKDSLKTVEAMQGATGPLAKLVLGDSLEAWKAWIAPVEVHLKKMEADGHLQTIDQVAEQYKQIAIGLDSHSASSGPQQINPENVRLILEMIMMFLKMWMGGGFPGFPGGGGT